MSTTPDHPHDPQGGPPPPPPPPAAGGAGPAGPTPPPYAAAPGPGGPGYGPQAGHGYRPQGGGPGYEPAGGHGYGPPPGAPGYAPSAYGPASVLSPGDQRTWSVVSHLSGIFVSVIGPLVVWLVFRGRGAYLEHQAKEALNFQITLVIAYFVGGILSIIGIGFLILLAAWVAAIVFAILAGVASSRGEPYRYPVNIRIIS